MLASGSPSILLRTTILLLALAVDKLLLGYPQLPTYLHHQYPPELVMVDHRLLIDLVRDLMMLVVAGQRGKRCEGLEVC